MTADFASLIWIERKTMDFVKDLKSEDKEIFDAIAAEFDRQQNQIELIASENIVSKAVLEAQGSILTNKYAEGYPAKRYYRGCEFVDVVENLAIERAKKLFDARFGYTLRAQTRWREWREKRKKMQKSSDDSVA